MKKRKWIWIVPVIIAVILTLSNPWIRTNLFVQLYHQQIEESFKQDASVPADDAVLFGYRSVNTWEGEHTMVEFLISASGFGSETSYYGCYYSPDDIPLAFQNLDTTLIPISEKSWEWFGEGDNRGETSKIMNGWYYFEAYF